MIRMYRATGVRPLRVVTCVTDRKQRGNRQGSSTRTADQSSELPVITMGDCSFFAKSRSVIR